MDSKEQALKTVLHAAKIYMESLSGRHLLFLCTDKSKKVSYIETAFDESRFLHLTGLKVDKRNISAVDFFGRCITNRLSVDDFEFAEDGTTALKLEVLPFVVTANLGNANMAGDFNGMSIRLFTEKIVGTVKAGIGFIKINDSDVLVPNTLIKADVRDYVRKSIRIVATFSKRFADETYSKRVYLAKGIDIKELSLPEELLKRLDLDVCE